MKKNKNELSIYIEQYALDNRLNLAEAILQILEEKDIDEQFIAENINEVLKQKLELEYKAKRMLR